MWLQHGMGKVFPTGLIGCIARRWIGSLGAIARLSYSPDINLVRFCMGTPEGACVGSVFQDYPVCSINTSGRYQQSKPMCLGEPCSALPSALKRKADTSKIYFKYEASMDWSSLSYHIWRYFLSFEIKIQNMFCITFQTSLWWSHILEI